MTNKSIHFVVLLWNIDGETRSCPSVVMATEIARSRSAERILERRYGAHNLSRAQPLANFFLNKQQAKLNRRLIPFIAKSNKQQATPVALGL